MLNGLDVALLVLCFYLAVSGWRRGLIRQLFDITGIFIAYFVALQYSSVLISKISEIIPLEQWLSNGVGGGVLEGFDLAPVLLRIIGFLLLFALVRLGVQLVAGLFHSVFSLPVLGTVNGFGGLILGGLKGLLFSAVLVGLLSLINTHYWQNLLAGSRVAGAFRFWLPSLYELLMSKFSALPG